MTFAEIEAKALKGEKVTDADIQSAMQADIDAKLQRLVKHLHDLEDPNATPEWCGGMFCSCNPTFRRTR